MNEYVLVSGDFTTWGGMDRANYEFAWYLADRVGATVHLVSFFVASPLAEHSNVTWHKVSKPLGMYMLAAPLLAHAGRRVARRLSRQGARVVVNGGNCLWPDVNWVHAVHAAWDNRHSHAPLNFRVRANWAKHMARRAEDRSLRRAKIVFTNSKRARQHVIESAGLHPENVHSVYYGIDADVFHPRSQPEREASRKNLGWPLSRPVVVFIGALGHDRNKGFDVLFGAWEVLCRDPAWDVDLVALGTGSEVELWRRRAVDSNLDKCIRMMGFTKDVRGVLTAADALVSPTHYDAYGLGVHEALCCGLPAFVTKSAGVAERFPDELSDLLLNDPPEAGDLAHRLRLWRENMPDYGARVERFGAELRQRTWTDMSREIHELMTGSNSNFQ